MIHDRRKTARHEAAHAAALLVRGHEPYRVTADRPVEGVDGWLEWGWSQDEEHEVTPESARLVAEVVMAGPLVEPATYKGFPPAFDELDLGAPGDAGQVAACAKYLGWSETDYNVALTETAVLVTDPEFLRMVDLIAQALELADHLDRNDIRRLLGRERRERYGIPDPQETT